jgi:hypothetical protein
MQQIAEGKKSLYEGHAEIQESGKLDDVVKRLKTFRGVINENSFEKQLYASEETINQAHFEINRIVKRLKTILKELESKNEHLC